MKEVFVESTNIISALGFSTEENIQNVLEGNAGIRLCTSALLTKKPFPAALIEHSKTNKFFDLINHKKKDYTLFEKIAILSLNETLKKSDVSPENPRCQFILSTTKGNISLLDKNQKHQFPDDRLNLFNTAKIISGFFNFKNTPMVVSNACISGLAAIILGQRLIATGQYDQVVINGTDVLSRFIVSGFQSFLSLSPEACKPFDINREGLTLGEGSATIILSNKKTDIQIVNGATSNDANHISGPSRTGEGLLVAINNTLKNHQQIDYISAHGTATPYNDDMESIAIKRSGLETVPVNSLKGFFGHTLGAAGVIESIIGIESLKRNVLIKSIGCNTPGTKEKINIIQNNINQELKSFLKLASGFGGCNAAALFLKHG